MDYAKRLELQIKYEDSMNNMVQAGFNAIQGSISDDVFHSRVPEDYDYYDNPVGHTICNLMHYCKFMGIDFEESMAFAKNHWEAEKHQTEKKSGNLPVHIPIIPRRGLRVTVD